MQQRFEYAVIEIHDYDGAEEVQKKMNQFAALGWRFKECYRKDKTVMTTYIFERPHPESQIYANNLSDYIANS